jgi:tRNA-dihydrouridine synthase B
MALAATALRPIRVGGLELSSPVLVAPMVGITDAPCRKLCREFGAGLVSTEMVAAEAVVRSTDAVVHLLDFPGEVTPVAAQLVGCDPGVMAAAAQVCVERGAVLVDVNLGCPVSKVVSRGSGAALALEAVRVPVTVKMRLGWDSATINAPELARALEDAGAAAVSVHGRTRCQKYEGTADWAQIARVKEAVGIPVFGSGDVEDVETLAGRIESGMVDGVVIARGMLGNFWLVRQAVHRLATGTLLADLDFAGRIALARRHLDMLCAYHGDARAMRIGRKYVAWTIRGCAGAARLRAEVQTMDTRERLDALLDRALASGPRPEGWFQPVFVSGDG